MRRKVGALEGELANAAAAQTQLAAATRRVAALESDVEAQTQEAAGLRRKISALEGEKGALGVAAS